MTQEEKRSRFTARLLRPKEPGSDGSWAFVVLPLDVSATLPRRGRTTVEGAMNGRYLQVLLEPDGQKSHWMRLDEEFLTAAGVTYGDVVEFEIMPVEQEPEPEVPADFWEALEAAPDARATWNQITTLARVDWIHWITSAKQAKTRAKRIRDACEMLASGEKRVCCFDPSGYYSKAFRAPEAAD